MIKFMLLVIVQYADIVISALVQLFGDRDSDGDRDRDCARSVGLT